MGPVIKVNGGAIVFVSDAELMEASQKFNLAFQEVIKELERNNIEFGPLQLKMQVVKHDKSLGLSPAQPSSTIPRPAEPPSKEGLGFHPIG
jgi:hypothetical protein